MIHARELRGRSVVDLDEATKLGRVHELILDPDGRRVAALVLRHGDTRMSGSTDVTIPASAIHAIGPDAITVRRGSVDMGGARSADTLPRLSDIVGRKVVSRSGVLLGRVADVLIASNDGRIEGYMITDHAGPAGKLEALFSGRKKDATRYLRADADLRPGKDLIVAPDDALAILDGSAASRHEGSSAASLARSAPVDTPQPIATSGSGLRWSDPAPQPASEWTRRDDPISEPKEPIR